MHHLSHSPICSIEIILSSPLSFLNAFSHLSTHAFVSEVLAACGLNNFVSNIRSGGNAKRFKDELNRFQRAANKNEKRVLKYIDAILKKKSRVEVKLNSPGASDVKKEVVRLLKVHMPIGRWNATAIAVRAILPDLNTFVQGDANTYGLDPDNLYDRVYDWSYLKGDVREAFDNCVLEGKRRGKRLKTAGD